MIFGLFPFVALLLLAGGETRASIAGIVLAGFSIGGILYALTVRWLVGRWRGDQLMIGGGVIAAIALALAAFELAWPVQLFAFTLLGFGFYTLHGSIQVQTTELCADRARRGGVDALVLVLRRSRQRAGAVRHELRLIGAPATLAVAGVLAVRDRIDLRAAAARADRRDG